MCQLALPIMVQLSRFFPSSSVIQPSDWPEACCAYQKPAAAKTNSPMGAAYQRFIVALLPVAASVAVCTLALQAALLRRCRCDRKDTRPQECGTSGRLSFDL